MPSSPVKFLRNLDLASFFKLTTRERFDRITPVCIVLLSLFGVFFIYSAQFARDGTQWRQQLLYLALGSILYLATSLLDYRIWLRYAHWVYLAGIVLLVLVLIPGIGTTHGMGARRWIDIGVAFQPSEFAKVSVLFITAALLTGSKLGSVADSLQVLIKLALAVGLPMLLIIAEPDLGSALVIAPMVFAMLFVSNLSLRFFAGALGVFALLVGIVALDVWRYANYMDENKLHYFRDRGAYESHSWLPLRDYQRNRVLAFALPDKIDPTGIGWNSRQSLISVGSGGLIGKGWTEGTQAKLGYLPPAVAHNDFIFSVIAEEKGFLGSITVVGLFGVVLWNGLRIAGLARDRFGALLALGVTALLAVHVFVNIAMTIGLVPVKGIPLPFISYGGTFVLSCCLLQGLVQSVYRFRRDT
ncbi:Rod shape-determining protein RodA [Lacunisphaera limnophila]|uniref:Rod shape-determining protein RodA n=1 Tax=Lacunisphaera limnophila TaxID=1838286 RepID=A0A1D8AUM6_9BACT|nr:Rod shape-determining protein RodA [Lacunisphaera limnophila]